VGGVGRRYEFSHTLTRISGHLLPSECTVHISTFIELSKYRPIFRTRENHMSDLNGKVAVVTGASKGIGAATARALAAAGAAVVVNYASSKEGAEKVVTAIKTGGGRAIAVKGDVGKSAEVKALFDEAKKAFGKVDILVNNAGIYRFDPIEDVTEDKFHQQFSTNVLGTLLATREAVKHFGNEGGSVINITSVASSNALPNTSIYSATKGALESATRVLAAELGPRNIRVNAIAPGGVETEGLHAMGIIGSDFEKKIVAETPLGRIGQPDDIAKVAVFLASDESRWVTGERVVVSGGHR
jgi:3-oxoacyl-[acyl-carrier protein] reductase